MTNLKKTSPEEPKSPSTENVPKNEPTTPASLLQDDKILSAISYISIACLLPLVLKPKSESCQFHGKQGLILFIFSIIILFILAIFPGLGLLLFLAYFALCVLAVYRAYNGEKWEIPVISIIAKQINLNKLNLPDIGVATKTPEPETKPEAPKEETPPPALEVKKEEEVKKQ